MAGSAGPRVCVAHLVRKANDIGAFRDFLASYRTRAAGAPHELLLIYKGFDGIPAVSAHEDLLEGVAHERLFVDDTGFDIGAYLATARRHECSHFLFLNSFSKFECDGWLEGFVRHGTVAGAGVVAATGSWQSVKSDYHELDGFHPRHRMVFYKRWIIAADLGMLYLLSIDRGFPEFPNIHVRSNAFFIARDLLLRLKVGRIRTKWDAYRFESGRQSFTQQVRAAGLKALVVGADGRAYEPDDWPASRTFWIGEQENLLVSDNQTRAYLKADERRRTSLSHHAWRRFPDGRPGSSFPDPWR